MTAPDNLYQLVEKFERDQSQFQQPDYNEAQLREQFVNPFFRALGWDLGEEVLHEAGLRSGGTIKHPDYTFLAGSRRAFYVETKKPSINIGNSVDPAEQLRSYGWSGNTALGILTNFAEFAVYDCRIEPKQGDSPAEARIMYLTHSQYLDQWERLQETLSPEAVRQGRHSDLLQATAKGVLRVDEAFLRDMESWRVDLAPDIYKQARFIDRQLSQREINHLVQRTIDRIVFLRIVEDRNLESYGRLERAASVRRNSYNEIKTLYLAADRKYNSGLFHFDPNDKSRPDADTLSLDIRIGDEILRKIIADLYPPKSRYQFSVISADILGQVYERFLGKVIEVRSDAFKTAVTVEEKPEVRKAGGVYYTPGYIVDYIMENTVGTLLKDKSPDEAMNLRVLDPACGSGSFLTGAYQYLLDWHLAQYRENPQRYKNRIRHSADGIILRIEEKRRILLDNIYGVDLDQNAVEVSKLSLLLKMLENEHDTLDIEEPLLPDLSGNIKWGNSLISSDFFSGDGLADLDDEELLRVKPFDWASGSGFGDIMAAGGFDAVIGNPPYVRSQSLGGEQREYYKNRYESATRTYDIYVLFVERAISIMSKSGKTGFILPNKFFTTDYGVGIRRVLAEKRLVDKIVDFEDAQVFSQAGTYTTLLFLSHDGSLSPEYAALGYRHRKDSSVGLADHLSSPTLRFEPLQITDDGSRWTLAPGERGKFLSNLQKKFSNFAKLKPHIFKGLKTSADKIYLVSLKNDGQNGLCTVVNGLGESVTIERRILKPVVKGGNVKRFAISNIGHLFIIYPYVKATNGKAELLDADHLADEFPRTWKYLNKYKAELGARDKGKWSKQDNWYAYARSQNIVTFLGKKFMLPYMSTRLQIALDDQNDLFFVNITTGGYGLRFEHRPHHDNFWLALFNSNLLNWCAKQMTNRFRGGYFAMNKQALERLPIRTIDFDNPADVALHDKIVALVERMLDLHRKAGLTAVQRGVVEQRIEAVDREIDELVYELYGLSEDEVAVVEGG